MSNIIIYSKDYCPYCVYAKQLLDNEGLSYKEIFVDQDPEQLKIMIERSGRRTVPQIFIDEQPIGGFDDLKKLKDSKQLQRLINRSKDE
jgi:glutaredoxin 3